MMKLLFIFLLSTLTTLSLADQSQAQAKYKRQYYKHWIDKDGDCQDERTEALIRYNVGKLVFKNDKECKVLEGEWHDPYSGQVFTHASDLDIDHIVTLKSSYYMGAQYWTPNEREAFANDPDNLIPVWKKLNREKGAKGPDEWLPPNLEFQCEYLKKWIAIRNKYKLHQPTQRAVDTINELAQKCLK